MIASANLTSALKSLMTPASPGLDGLSIHNGRANQATPEPASMLTDLARRLGSNPGASTTLGTRINWRSR